MIVSKGLPLKLDKGRSYSASMVERPLWAPRLPVPVAGTWTAVARQECVAPLTSRGHSITPFCSGARWRNRPSVTYLKALQTAVHEGL